MRAHKHVEDLAGKMAVFYKTFCITNTHDKAMGADELWKHCVPGAKSKAPQHFKTAKNTRIAVDMSFLLHSFTKRPKNALSAC